MDAIYARQSIDKKDSVSIEGQIDLCRRECKGEPRVFTDKGYSGKNTDRPDFKKLMQAVEKEEISRIVVYRLDRISRSISDFGRIWELLNQHKVEFVSVNEKFDTSTPVGRAMIYIIMVFAQLERETIAERIKDNYHQRAKRGAYLGGPAPFGFTIKRTLIGGKAASMLAETDNIALVKEMFRMYSTTNASLGHIARYLHDKNIPGISRSSWDNISIARILHNPVYVKANADVYFYFKQKGVILYNDIDDFKGKKGCWLFGKRDRNANKYTNLDDHLLAIAHHDGVIDSDTWLKCQYKLDNNRQVKNSGQGRYSWLTGLVKCGYCGYSMRAINADKGKYIYFACSGKINLNLCNAKLENPHVSYVESVVSARIKDRLSAMKNSEIATADVSSDDANALKIELVSIEGQISNLIDGLAESNNIAGHYINERIMRLDARKNEIMEELKKAMLPKQNLSLPVSDFDSLSFDEKKSTARILIKKVFLANEGIRIEWAL